MKITLNKNTCLVLLVTSCLLENHYGQSPASAPSAEIITLEQPQSEQAHPWTLVPAYSWSFFNKGRDSWQTESIDLYYYLPDEKLLLGGSVDMMHRPPNGNDIMYAFNASWYVSNDLEIHGEIALTQDADFLPSERYSLGLQYRLNPKLGLLFDVEEMAFGSYAPAWGDGITQIRPGVSYWFTEKTYATLRYTHGWVHNQADYDYYTAAINFGDLPRDGQLSIALSYGTDPDLDFGTTGTALSDAYTFSIFYKQPINPDLSIFAGVEYVYRLRPDNGRELYQMWTPTIGLSWKF
jgi:YaiO family outer membrane protein